MPSSVFQTRDIFCTLFFDPEDPEDGFKYFGTAALTTRETSVTLNNRCTSNTLCCTRVWCHSSNANNCFDVRYSSSFVPPPAAGKPPTPLTGGEIASIVVSALIFCCCMSAGIYVKNKLGISDEAVEALAGVLVTINPISAAASVQSWGSSEAQGGMRKLSSASHPQATMEVVNFSPQAAPSQQQPQGGMLRADVAPQAYPMVSSPATK